MRKKIKFTSVYPDLNLPHPVVASKAIPQWYRESEPYVNNVQTIKSCVPLLDAMISGYMITLPCDIYFENGIPQDIGKIITIETHIQGQLANLTIPNEYYSEVHKWVNNFILETPKGYSTLFTHPSNRIDLPFYTLSGIVDTDKFPLQTNFPFLIKKDFVGIIPAGTPIAQAIPFKRENWESTIEDQKQYVPPHFTYTMHNPPFNFYKKHFWTRKKYS